MLQDQHDRLSSNEHGVTALRDAQVFRAGDRMRSAILSFARAGFVGTIDPKTLGGQNDML